MVTFLSVVGAFMLIRFAVAMHHRRRWAYGGGCGAARFGGGRGFGGFHGFRGFKGRGGGGPVVIGDVDGDDFTPARGRNFDGRNLAARLELNERQKAEVAESLSLIAMRSRGDRRKLAAGLAAAGEEPFAATRVAAATGSADKDVLDAFEHIHNVLTPEQREVLRSL